MRTLTLLCLVGSLIVACLSATTGPWYITGLWSVTASIWAFTAGIEYTKKALTGER